MTERADSPREENLSLFIYNTRLIRFNIVVIGFNFKSEEYRVVNVKRII